MAHTATSSNEWITDTSLAETAQPQLNDQETHSSHAAPFGQRPTQTQIPIDAGPKLVK